MALVSFMPSQGAKRIAVNPDHVVNLLEISSMQTNVVVLGGATHSVKGSYETVGSLLDPTFKA